MWAVFCYGCGTIDGVREGGGGGYLADSGHCCLGTGRRQKAKEGDQNIIEKKNPRKDTNLRITRPCQATEIVPKKKKMERAYTGGTKGVTQQQSDRLRKKQSGTTYNEDKRGRRGVQRTYQKE